MGEFLSRWWRCGRRPYWSDTPRCVHQWDTVTVTKMIAGREAVVTNGTCKKCGESGVIATHWADGPAEAEGPVTVTLSRREYDAILRNLPAGSIRAYGPNGCDLADARATLEAAGRARPAAA
jgi:hypothetical protein